MADNRQGFFRMSQAPLGEASTTDLPALNFDTSRNQEVIQSDNGERAEVLQLEGLGATEHTIESLGSCSDRTFIPVVNDSTKPVVGMEFDTIDVAYNFYNLYAKEAGFSVRRSSDRKDPNGFVRYKNFVCAKEGKTDNKASRKGRPLKRTVPETRVGCKASMSIKKNKTGTTYIVFKFCEGHSHPLTTPTKTHLLRSHRKDNNVKKKLINTFEATDLRPSHQMSIFEEQSGGYRNIGSTGKDVHNCGRDKREEMKGLDAQMLYDYLQDKADQNSFFTYTIKADDENRITHVFWADDIAKANYSRFGTVVSFDIAYRTNRYNMVFAQFTGVNHHGRSVALGCGFLPKETSEDFVWLFEEWRKAMPGDPPKCIVTDEDLGMTKAVAQVFSNAIHYYCIWHIMNKAPKYLDSIVFGEDFNEAFKKVVYHPEMPAEFEKSWSIFLEKYELKKHNWLRDLYELRERWIPAYVRDNFFLGIQSTQCSKMINKFLMQHAHKNNSFCDFMLRYETFVGRQRHRELKDDYETLSNRTRLKTSSLVELQMADIFTRRVFLKFQVELFNCFACKKEFLSSNEIESYFAVYPARRNDDDEHKKKKPDAFDRTRKVVLQKANSFATCSCRKFEFEGIPCRHILSVLVKHVDIQEMPKQFIVKRWTRYAKQGDVLVNDWALLKANADDSLVSRHSLLSLLSSAVANEGCLTKEAFQVAFELLSDVIRKLRDINLKIGVTTQYGSTKRKETVTDMEYLELMCSQQKGCGKRLKPTREKVHKKVFKCRGCNKCDSHDKQTCLLLNNLSMQTREDSTTGESDEDDEIYDYDTESSSGPDNSSD